jgi:hypothetical protein
MDYNRIHENIMKSDPNIRLVTKCDLNGKILHSGHQEGILEDRWGALHSSYIAGQSEQ